MHATAQGLSLEEIELKYSSETLLGHGSGGGSSDAGDSAVAAGGLGLPSDQSSELAIKPASSGPIDLEMAVIHFNHDPPQPPNGAPNGADPTVTSALHNA